VTTIETIAAPCPPVTSAALRKALDVILRAIEAPATAQGDSTLRWVPSSALDMTGPQATRWAKAHGIRHAKAGRATMLHRADVERFLEERASGASRKAAPSVVALVEPDVDAGVLSVLRLASGDRR